MRKVIILAVTLCLTLADAARATVVYVFQATSSGPAFELSFAVEESIIAAGHVQVDALSPGSPIFGPYTATPGFDYLSAFPDFFSATQGLGRLNFSADFAPAGAVSNVSITLRGAFVGLTLINGAGTYLADGYESRCPPSPGCIITGGFGASVPEPAAWAPMLTGAALVMWKRRRNSRNTVA